MPLSLSKTASLAKDATLRDRVAAGFAIVAVNKLGDTTSEYEGKQQAQQLAQRVMLTDTIDQYGIYVMTVLTDPIIQSNGTDASAQTDITDQMITDRLDSIWLYLAGIVL